MKCHKNPKHCGSYPLVLLSTHRPSNGEDEFVRKWRAAEPRNNYVCPDCLAREALARRLLKQGGPPGGLAPTIPSELDPWLCFRGPVTEPGSAAKVLLIRNNTPREFRHQMPTYLNPTAAMDVD